MRKKIVISLAVIAVAASAVIGGTVAYFSDIETAKGNTFSAGTIDIAIDGENPWTGHYDMPDLKPGETGYINFNIQNVGQNPVNVSKHVGNFIENTGTESEPECNQGCWDNGAKACDWHSQGCTSPGEKNDVQTQIIYDLSVEVYNSNGVKIWWQSIYTDAEGKMLSAVYPDASTYVALGMIPVGGHMKVTQSYHFSPNAGNEYQGDRLSFDMTIKGEQLPQGDGGITSVALENKAGAPNWDIIQGDNIEGTLSYKSQGPKFDYNFTGKVRTTGDYKLIYVGTTNNYPCVGSVVLGTDSFTALTAKTISGQVDIGASITNGKIWLIPSSSYVGGIMTSWPEADILFETGLITYTKN